MNSVAVRLTQKVGVKTVIATAQRLGISSELRPTGGIALGASEVTLLDLTGAYAAFANQGRRVLPYGISEISDAAGRLLFQRDRMPGDPVGSARHRDDRNSAGEGRGGSVRVANGGRRV